MSRRSVLALALVTLPAALVVGIGACGGATIADDDVVDTPSTSPHTPNGGHGNGGKGGVGYPGDASAFNPFDAAPATCACAEELTQVDGSCNFTIGDGLIACVADHTTGSYSPLATIVTCTSDGGPDAAVTGWTPSAEPNQLTLCGCTPGQSYSLCARYY